jgi:hypothetical protein
MINEYITNTYFCFKNALLAFKGQLHRRYISHTT